MNKDEINKVLSIGYYHVFYKGKLFKELQTKSVKELKQLVKDKLNTTQRKRKVIVVRLKYELGKLFIMCIEMTITPDLFLINDKDDYSITVKYTAEDLEDYGFNMEDLKKIIVALKNRDVDLSKSIIDVNDIFDVDGIIN